jgi:hypothetical protein
LAHKAEHAVDMDTGAVVAVTLQEADLGDTTTVSIAGWKWGVGRELQNGKVSRTARSSSALLLLFHRMRVESAPNPPSRLNSSYSRIRGCSSGMHP